MKIKDPPEFEVFLNLAIFRKFKVFHDFEIFRKCEILFFENQIQMKSGLARADLKNAVLK